MLRLLKEPYKYPRNAYKLFFKDNKLNRIESQDVDRLYFISNNVSIKWKNIILKRFCGEIKKIEIFTNYINSDNYFSNTIFEIKDNFLNSNFEILSAYIYYINFDERCFSGWSEKFILEISKIRKEDTNFDEKFKEYKNHFDNKEGILQYLNEYQYSILKSFLYII